MASLDTKTDTRSALVLAAVDAFSRSGYEGVSIRDIERRAGINRGLAAYHFGTKDALWEAAVDWLMSQFHDEMDRYREFMTLVSADERGKVLLKVFVKFVAKHPEFFRLLVLEGGSHSERSRKLVDEYLRRLVDYFHRVTGTELRTAEQAAVDHFMFVGSASMIFAARAQCEFLFGVDPGTEDFVERFADLVAEHGYQRGPQFPVTPEE